MERLRAVMQGMNLSVRNFTNLPCCVLSCTCVPTTNSCDCKRENAVSSLKSPVMSYSSIATRTSLASRRTYRRSSCGSESPSSSAGKDSRSCVTFALLSAEYVLAFSLNMSSAITRDNLHSSGNSSEGYGPAYSEFSLNACVMQYQSFGKHSTTISALWLPSFVASKRNLETAEYASTKSVNLILLVSVPKKLISNPAAFKILSFDSCPHVRRMPQLTLRRDKESRYKFNVNNKHTSGSHTQRRSRHVV